MKYWWYILLLLAGVGARIFAPAAEPSVQPSSSADCAVQQMDYQALTGIQGEPLIIAGTGSVEAQVPTTLSGNSRRVNLGKNRTRTAILRVLIQNHQSSFIVFRGRERLESSPFAASAGSAYYVYALRRILC